MSGENLLVVESPAKAKTITKYLGSKFTVLSSRGHVRGIPSRSNAVKTDQAFETEYEISSGSERYLSAITDAAKKATNIYMATDPDREGEAIAWHVLEVLKDRKIDLNDKVHRITFNEVTPDAIKAALKAPREIDMDLVSAQRTRQSLDYLVGFSISPVLWRKLPGSKSAGRVQSVALRLLCEREHEIMKFKPMDYWSIAAAFSLDNKETFSAELSEINTKKVEKFSFTSEEAAKSVVALLKQLKYSIDSIEKKEVQRNPEAPFITSTLIQAASTGLKMSSKKAMQIAQKLYEGMNINDKMIGLITYMRTDSINVSAESVDKARDVIGKLYGEKYLPKEARVFKKKVKNAQEAHEAIRPTDPSLTPEKIKEFLTDDEFQLYDLIWRRFIACQMAPVRVAKTTIKILGQQDKATDKALLDHSVMSFFESEKATASFKVIGTIILFDGFQKVMSGTENKNKGSDDDMILPIMSEGDKVNLADIQDKKHTTTAPSRYSEATIVKKMEELGIGRPSTYATIISILQERQYVLLNKNKFFVEDRGELVNTFLTCFFTKYVEYGFTAALEEELDDIANGEKKSMEILRSFWDPFKKNVDEISQMLSGNILEQIQKVLSEFLFENPDEKCPKCQKGELRLKNSKFSPFIGCSNYPECNYAQKFKLHEKSDNSETTAEVFLKTDDESSSPMIHSGNIRVIAQQESEQIMLNQGQYGYYISLCKDGVVQKNFSLSKDIDPETFNFEFKQLKKLFEMPYKIGNHPDGEEIKIGIGKYGPYVLHKKKFYSIKNRDMMKILEFTLEDAINLISGKK